MKLGAWVIARRITVSRHRCRARGAASKKENLCVYTVACANTINKDIATSTHDNIVCGTCVDESNIAGLGACKSLPYQSSNSNMAYLGTVMAFPYQGNT